MDRSDNNWLAVLQNFSKACMVCNRLGKMLLQEGSDPQVSAIFYRAVVQSVLIFGLETWVFPYTMSRKIEGVHVGFLRRITRQRAVQQKDGTWRKVAAEMVLEKAGTQPLGTYIERRQAKLS